MRLDYSRKLKSEKFRHERRKKRIFLLLVFFLTAFAMIWLVFLSNFFLISYFQFSQESEFLKKENLEKDLKEYLSSRRRAGNIFLTGKSDFADFFSQYPEIKSFKIKKDWKNKEIFFEIKEKEIRGEICQENNLPKCFYFDDTGFIFHETSNKSADKTGNRIIFSDVSGRFYEKGEYIFPEGVYLLVKRLIDLAEEKFDFRLGEINNNNLNLVFEKEKKWKIFFDTSDLERSYGALSNLILGGFDFDKLNYLDLRYLPNIYYKEI